jgi:hypothetical protein
MNKKIGFTIALCCLGVGIFLGIAFTLCTVTTDKKIIAERDQLLEDIVKLQRDYDREQRTMNNLFGQIKILNDELDEAKGISDKDPNYHGSIKRLNDSFFSDKKK